MWNQSRKHAERVFVEIERLIKESGIEKDDINLAVVTSGPGSFTGVRLSATIGKSLQVLGLDVKAVSTLQLVGFGILKLGLPVVSLFPGRRNRYYTLLRERIVNSAEVLDLTEEELFSILKEHPEYKIVYKGTVPETIKNKFGALYETTPLSLTAALLPFEAPQMLKSLHFYYVRDHDAKPSRKRL
jgi:tRNA threonylcarbamoyladenosine biosynthesis protein TsaB